MKFIVSAYHHDTSNNRGDNNLYSLTKKFGKERIRVGEDLIVNGYRVNLRRQILLREVNIGV